MSSLDKRPRPEETTDDLINLERQFHEVRKSNPGTKPAATAVRVNPKNTSTQNQSVPTSGPGLHSTESVEESCFTGFIVEKNTPKEVRSQPEFLSERKSKFKSERQSQRLQTGAIQSHPSLINDAVKKKIQMSYDLFDPFKSSETSGSSTRLVESISESSSFNTEQSLTVDTSIGAKIHPLLAGYSEADVIKAQESLLASMKPETLEILKKRRVAAEASKTKDNKSPSINPAAIELGNLTANIQTEHEMFDKFPHMDKIESEKLEWTKSVQPQEIQNNTETNKNSVGLNDRSGRFGLDGRLMTKELESDPNSWNKGLHHHGEEMERPGYTIEELFTLARSTFPHQKAFGFNILAQIFTRAHNGEFDLTLDSSIFQACNELDFISVLRSGLDVRDSLSLNAAIHCLSALIFPEQEELCLDIVFNWPNATPFPCLTTELEEFKTTNETPSKKSGETEDDMTESDLKDFQLVKNDLLKFLVDRTDILVRFNYILKERLELLNELGVEGILKILIRVARHSPNAIMVKGELLDSVHKHYMNSNWTQTSSRAANMSGIPLSLAVKLFRILASSSKENASKLYSDFELFPAIMSYLAFKEWGNQNVVKNVEFLVLEASNLWEVFLTYGFGMEEYMSFFPVMMTSFQALISRDILPSFDLTFAARLNALLGKVLLLLSSYNDSQRDYAYFKESVGFVSSFVVKMLVMLERNPMILDWDLSLLAILKGLECLTVAQKYDKFPMVDNALVKFVHGSAYVEITKCLQTHSVLLFPKDIGKGKDRYPSNVSTCNALYFGGIQTPLLDKGSPFAFMTCLLRYENEPLRKIILNDHCRAYLSKLGSFSVHLTQTVNAFLRFELYCLREVMNLVTSFSEYTYLLAKVFPLVQTGDEGLSQEFLSILITSTGIENPQSLIQFYSKFLYISTYEDKSSHLFKVLNRKVICYNWILEPLSILYTSTFPDEKVKKTKDFEKALDEIVRTGVMKTLEFVIFCLEHLERVVISSRKDIPALYTRVALVFMMENLVFLDPTVRVLLQKLLNLLLSNSIWKKAKGKAIFSNYNNQEGFPAKFATFYTDLMEAFGSNSFGDCTFSAYVMLPIGPLEDVQIRSLFWNDTAIKFIRTTLSESTIPLEYFTSSAPETNSDMLQIYANAIGSKRVTAERNSFLYAILDKLKR